MFGIGYQEIVFIVLIVFLLFGAKALPEIVRALAKASQLFKQEVQKIGEDSSESRDQPERTISRSKDDESTSTS